MRSKLKVDHESDASLHRLPNGLIQCEDGLLRPEWAAAPGLMRDYYDTEWGMPTRDERDVFERLSLEIFQAGLSWKTILLRRDAFRKAFANFEPESIANFNDATVETLLSDASIIRNRRKIEAIRTNARVTVRMTHAPTSLSLSELVWSFERKPQKRPATQAEVTPITPESIALSKKLKKEGFVFVGPTTVMSTLEALGVIDMHVQAAFSPRDQGNRPPQKIVLLK